MPISASNIRFQDYEFQTQVSSGTWRWVTRLDVTGARPVYEIRGIVSPFGLLRDSTPIPGEVVQSMSDSIDALQQNFPPAILIGPPAALTFEVDEGRGFSDPQDVLLTNNGVFGSLLGTVLTASAGYVVVTPTSVGNLAANEVGSFSVAVDSTSLLSANSPYNEQINVTDPDASNNPQVLTMSVVARPKATIDVAPLALDFAVVKPVSGPFPPVPTQQFTVSNLGPAGSVLNYQIQKLTGLSNLWLVGIGPVTGQLSSGGSQIITVSVVPDESLSAGTYVETLRISGYSTNTQIDITVQLVVS